MELQYKKRPPGLVLESIGTQVDDFGVRLEGLVALIVNEIKDKGGKEVDLESKHPVITKIQDVVFDRLGLKIDLVTDSHLAATLPFYSNRNHIFLPDFIRGSLSIREQTKLLRDFDGKKGTVNLETAKVTGIFSEYEHPVFINFNQMVNDHGFGAAEITGALLHELGHDFYSCYYADRSDKTNQVLASIARHMLSTEKGDIEYVYKELKEIKPSITKQEVDKMVNGNRVVAGAAWFKTVIGVVKSQLDDDTYSDTSFEQRADNFASRFGYGKSLVLLLDRLHRHSPEKNQVSKVLAQLLSAAVTISLFLIILGSVGAGAIGTAFVFSFYSMIFVTLFREDVKDYTYDGLKMRYTRVRMDVIDQLKSPRLKKDTVRQMLETIYELDEAIKSTSTVKTLPSYIANFVFTGARQADKSITDQQLVEALASNDLFIQAAELRLQA